MLLISRLSDVGPEFDGSRDQGLERLDRANVVGQMCSHLRKSKRVLATFTASISAAHPRDFGLSAVPRGRVMLGVGPECNVFWEVNINDATRSHN